MLVMTREAEQRILIGDDIVITVLYVGRERVKIGIEAPAHVQVDREEVRAARLAAGAKTTESSDWLTPDEIASLAQFYRQPVPEMPGVASGPVMPDFVTDAEHTDSAPVG